MPVKEFNAKVFAEKLAETGNAALALQESGAYPDSDSYDENWWCRTGNRYKSRPDVQEALVEIYSRKAAMEYADCLPLAASRVKEFLQYDFQGNAKAMKSQADLGAKILEDANIALGGSKYKQPVIENRNELLDQLASLIGSDKRLLDDIVGRAVTIVDGSAATDVTPKDDESGGVLPSVPTATEVS